jgi:phosphoribosylaminoimidazole-succinocarboxamide synthase
MSEGPELVHIGKVRDVYQDGEDLLLVASDRVSVYDVILPTPIPDKGKILTALSLWWFDRLAETIPNHVISATDVPKEWIGRAIRCQRLDMLPVECIARGYLAGLGLEEYKRHRAISGVSLPAGLLEGSRLPEPIFTPTTKAQVGTHDEFITEEDVARLIDPELAEVLGAKTLKLYQQAAEIAAGSGIIIADTKLEFGMGPQGLTLGDEIFTPDSSRFWPADTWQPGNRQHALDKQFVREWANTVDWDRTAPGPEIPENIVEATHGRYVIAYESITGEKWH